MVSFHLSNAMGYLFYMRTTPIPFPNASHSNSNGNVKLGATRIGHELIISFSFSNVCWDSSLHVKSPLFVKSVRGVAI